MTLSGIFCRLGASGLIENSAMNRNSVLLIVLILLFQDYAAWGADIDEPGVSYFTDKQRGWFWYEVQPEPV
jgi:conjugal transfer pilus assembly protein TraF